jgi:hypothetical protein
MVEDLPGVRAVTSTARTFGLVATSTPPSHHARQTLRHTAKTPLDLSN